jgi:NAD(P)-dependent dehydrogenase (short-subunit alcohol dehydrogenase family)
VPQAEPTIIITGSTDGLGKRVAQELSARGAHVLVHGRNQEKLERAASEVGATGAYLADLSSLARVRSLADRVNENEDRLDVLVNNAGIVSLERQESEDSYELGFAVNYLSHFLLTELLLPLLRASAPSRIVNVSSIGQTPIDFDDVMLERSYEASRSYSQSKLAQIMHAFELAERERDVTANALHPATLMDTNLVTGEIGREPMTSVEEGAEATMRLIADPELDGVTGRYFDGKRESTANPQAYDAEARKRLWALSEELTR